MCVRSRIVEWVDMHLESARTYRIVGASALGHRAGAHCMPPPHPPVRGNPAQDLLAPAFRNDRAEGHSALRFAMLLMTPLVSITSGAARLFVRPFHGRGGRLPFVTKEGAAR